MTPATSSTILSTASSELRFEGAGRTSALHVTRSRRARAMRLSVDMHDGQVKLVLPFRASLRGGLTFADQQRAWIEARLAALPEAMPIVVGSEIQCGDDRLTIDWNPARPRPPRRDGALLRVGGPRETLG
ncbi:MAG: metal-dependent hydrolase, partial [Sphingomonas sp.]|nr:metal-dependent hydrolase [Sphingomonas sp.]